MEKSKETPNVTDLNAVKARLDGQVHELPDFGDGEPFVARLRRVSLLEMAQNGDIPNELLGAVSDLYFKGTSGMKSLQDTAKSFRFIAEKSLVEPSFEDIQAAGLELTDAQLLAIYMYTVGGVSSLRSFRGQ
jgi:hypothetical protein